ncbi:MAG TPA: hypothetical protein VFA26_17520, partial [Gemmataceae bacterium]|nr:hypothetical protein [Gemmataceae bacterium]
LGEEGGVTRALNEQGGMPAPTTEPFGEEAGNVTSRAVPGLEDGAAAGGPTTQALREEGGGPSTRTLGEEGGVTTKALNEEGAVTGALNETGAGAPTVQVKPESKDLSDKQMASAWADMAAADKAKAVQGCAILYSARKAVPFLKGHLTFKTPEVDEKRLAKLIADLDSDTFTVREKAEADLAAMGQAAVPALEKAMKDSASTEVRMRARRLLDKAKTSSLQAQAERGLQVLVALRTKEARELLETLANGAEKEWMTSAAKDALKRMPK